MGQWIAYNHNRDVMTKFTAYNAISLIVSVTYIKTTAQATFENEQNNESPIIINGHEIMMQFYLYLP